MMSLDTHMAMGDYHSGGDIDMHQEMHPQLASESWQIEMEDDSLLGASYTDHDSNHSVEVDMQDFDADIEIDMDDEPQYDEMSSDVLLDVEVHDASTPLDTTIVPVENVDSSESHSFQIDSPAMTNPLFLAAAETPAMSPLPPVDTELPDAVAREPLEVAQEEPRDEENADAQQTTDLAVEVVALLADEESGEATEEVETHEESALEDSPREAQQNAEETKTDAFHPDEPQQAPSEVVAAVDADVQQDGEAESTIDPHEISEGVYIDPPPAVIVSFEASGYSDVCLFNQPPRSRSPSPSREDSGHGYQVFTLLLHHRPILYYEPLTSVFEALRQEEYVASMSQLADAELVLDAYDLQLEISEDNVYAREVTLHDLNVLHDGSDISGPLRLRLKSIVPRFILRYHLLQDQVARLNLAIASNHSDTVNETSNHQPQALETSTEQQNEPQEPLSDLQQREEINETNSTPLRHPTDPPLETKQTSEYQEDNSEDQQDQQDEPAEPVAEETGAGTQNASTSPEEAEEATEDQEEEYVELHEESGGDGETAHYNEEGDEAEVPAEGEGEADADADADADGEGEAEGEAEGQAETEGLPDLPEVDDEEFSVVEAQPKPIIPLTGDAVVEDIGNEPEKKLLDLTSGPTGELGPSNQSSEAELSGHAEATTSANNSADSSAYDAAPPEEEVYDDDQEVVWDDSLDTTWDADPENETASNESSVTLSSRGGSKRSFHEVELENDDEDRQSPPGSPGAKRTRVD